MKKGYKALRRIAGRLHNRYVTAVALAAAIMVVNTQAAFAAGTPSPKPVFNFNGNGKVPSTISGPFERGLDIALFIGAAISVLCAIGFFIATLLGKKTGGKLALAVIGAVVFAGFAHFFGGVTSVVSYVLG